MKRTQVFLLALILMPLSGLVQAQSAPFPLGRLFFTPETRVQLERQRQRNIQEARSLEAGTLRLDGVVLRSSGKSTVWDNQQDTRETGVVSSISRTQPGQAKLSSGNEVPADIKVGVTLDRTTRETTGGLAGGEIRVGRPGTQK